MWFIDIPNTSLMVFIPDHLPRRAAAESGTDAALKYVDTTEASAAARTCRWHVDDLTNNSMDLMDGFNGF